MSYIGAEPTTAAFPFDQFSGTGAATSFTLTYAPASATSILVAISGVTQNPNLYSVIGTTLSFSPAPPAGTNNISVLYLGMPVIGSTSPGNTAFLSSTDLTATAGQTVFASAGSYTPGFVQVYRNGARLGNADFTATNGTTITLANAATAGVFLQVLEEIHADLAAKASLEVYHQDVPSWHLLVQTYASAAKQCAAVEEVDGAPVGDEAICRAQEEFHQHLDAVLSSALLWAQSVARGAAAPRGRLR